MYELPLQKRKAIVAEFKSVGVAWVNAYPSLMADCVDRWGLKLLGTASAGLPMNMIHYAETREGHPVVLKVGVPHPEQKTELLALLYYEGRHAVRVIDSDDKSGAILMERIFPGTNLRAYGFRADMNDALRSQVSIELMNVLPVSAAAIDGLPTFDEWLSLAFSRFRNHTKSNDHFLSFINLTESLYAEIKTTYPETFLLHGDLHHENILRDDAVGWVAIDPKGVIGPKIMECGRFIQNFIEDEIPSATSLGDATDKEIMLILEERLKVFNNVTGFDQHHLAMVTFIDQVLSTCWSMNAGQVVDLRKIKLIKNLLNGV